MIYYVVKQAPVFHQMTLEEYLFEENARSYVINDNESNTRTFECKVLPEKLREAVNVNVLIGALDGFNAKYKHIREAERKDYYHSFKIPKKSGGYRQIDAPVGELMSALRELKDIFEVQFGALYHTSAFAYIKGRSTIDAVKKHQANESKWFAKYDLSNFFGSTTPEFVMKMLGMIYPFNLVCESEDGKKALEKALDLAFLNGGLPQGTPISPMLTNIIMIPFDFNISRNLRQSDEITCVYTRYADDFLVSSRRSFDWMSVLELINGTLKEFGAPFRLNEKKTRYGSSSGRNWNLGVMLNKDNEITVGHEKKRRFKAMLTNYILDKKSGKRWDLLSVQQLDGLISYFYMVEGDKIISIINKISKKFGANILYEIKRDLSIK